MRIWLCSCGEFPAVAYSGNVARSSLPPKWEPARQRGSRAGPQGPHAPARPADGPRPPGVAPP
eukprot:2251620-Heterocapsa_arctica.AAC.1